MAEGSEVHSAETRQPKRPALSWGTRIKKKLKPVAPFLGKFRPLVGQCCHQCTPESLGRKLLRDTPALGFWNLLRVNETHTRYRGWLVRRVCSVVFICGRDVHSSPLSDRLLRIRDTERAKRALTSCCSVNEGEEAAREILALTEASQSSTLIRLVGWLLLKVFSLMFCSVQVNLNQMAALHQASKLDTPLVYVYIRQSVVDQALISLTLLCHNLRVPYSVYPARVHNGWMRVILHRLGTIFLPEHAATEQEAETHSLYSPIMTSLVGELLMAGESLSVGVCDDSGWGGQWLARVRQALAEGLVPDVSVVPVGISYDCPPSQSSHPQYGALSVLWFVRSLLGADERGGVRIHFAQAFSLKEMTESGKCRVDGRRPLKELLLPAILQNRMDAIFGQKDVSWLLPPTFLPEMSPSERQMTVALTLHLMHSVSCSMAVMSTSIVSCLLLHKHRGGGVRVGALCREVCWLLEEVLFKRCDVGFGGSVLSVVYHALSVLRPHLLLAAAPPTGEPLVVARPDPHTLLSLSQNSALLTHTFITEAVGACALSALLCEVTGCGGGAWMECDVAPALGQEELTEKSLQLTHLLPAGCLPPCQAAHTFALDAVDSLVRCGILIMEEQPHNTPVCDFWKKQGVFSWTATADSDRSSDSECEEQNSRSYRLSQPSQCPGLLPFFCSLLSGQLRALCWAIESLHLLPFPITDSECVTQLHVHLKNKAQLDRVHYESSSIKLVRMALRTLTDLGVLLEDRQREDVYVAINPLFLQNENKQKLLQFVSQFVSV